jgi:hypothetical protein
MQDNASDLLHAVFGVCDYVIWELTAVISATIHVELHILHLMILVWSWSPLLDCYLYGYQ